MYVQVNSSSAAIVTARIAGNLNDAGRHVVTYFYNYPYLEYVSGNDQFGATGGRVEDPLVVRVLDGEGGRPVPKQVVKFIESSAGSDSM